MHRKKVRRWHKLLSVSGIIVAVFGMFYVSAATAESGGPTPDGIYGPRFSKDDAQMWYLDFPNNIVGLQTSDLYLTGSSTSCTIDPVPPLTGFSFGIWVRGCSDGNYRINLKAESVAYQNGVTGPSVDFIGAETVVDSTPLDIAFQNLPTQTNSPTLEFQIAVNHPMVYQQYFNFSLTGTGCNLISNNPTSYGLVVLLDSCRPGVEASLTLNPNSIQDKFGNYGPELPITSPTIKVSYTAPSPTSLPSASPTPSVSPSASQSASPAPSASPTSSPTPTATSSPSPSDIPASLAVVDPPTEPPAAPPAPTGIQQEPAAPVVSDEAPLVQDSPGSSHSLTPIALVGSKIVQVKKQLAVEHPDSLPAVETPETESEPIRKQIIRQENLEATPSFNWQSVGYLAIVFGGVAGAVGGALLLQRITRVRRMRFS